ncbi:unnamed protein product [Rotaria sordida]|uniref:Uncharacterized protein n=1 Tax=Rotaria sordida TaxID=392033 RepID=A0A820BG79_9BILA|nr:unnamed protein product [Rotaria sordida]CAF1483943.1 unnamed protein product [Rotaria sordida]CAF1648454.1 unnamed protein product [Rotaria sordida]CAF4207259.1 unnamed protein product [Rotaria sordida]
MIGNQFHPITTSQHSTSQQSTPVRRTTTDLYPTREELTVEQRKKIHNRSCTLRQRKRYYNHELILRNIYPRFRIQQIKSILKQIDIEFRAVNTSTSKISRKTSLYIGVTNPSELKLYETKTKNLFTRQNYYKIRHQTKKSRYNDNRMNHH